MIINGTLAGLVAITAPCDAVSMIGALVIGGLRERWQSSPSSHLND